MFNEQSPIGGLSIHSSFWLRVAKFGKRTALSISLSVFLLAGMLTFGPAEFAVAATHKTIPAIKSPKDSSRAASVQNQLPAKSSNATLQAGAKELINKRTEFTDQFQNPDGTIVKHQYLNQHYMNINKQMVPIDTTLKKSGVNFATTTTPVATQFSTQANSTALVQSADSSGKGITLSLDGAGASTATVKDSTATYPAVMPNVDISYQAEKTGFKESIILKSTAVPPTFTFPLKLNGLKARIDSNTESVVYSDSSGADVAYTPGGYMEDSKVDPKSGEAPRTDNVHYTLVGSGDTQALQVSIDTGWLNDPSRVFPVTVDPSWTYPRPNQDDTYTMSGFTRDNASDNVIKVGSYYDNNTEHTGQGYLNFTPDPTSNGTTILSAKLSMWTEHAYTCTPEGIDVYRVRQAWGGHTMTQYPGANIGYPEVQSEKWDGCNGDGTNGNWATWDVTNIAQYWAANPAQQFGLALRVPRGAEDYPEFYKRYYSMDGPSGLEPRIDIQFDRAPTTPSGASPVNNSVLSTTNLSFTANASSDPDGDAPQYQFQVSTGLDGQTGRVITSNWTNSNTWTPPDGTFWDGGKFYWIVQARDSAGLTTPWSAPQAFRIDFRLGQRDEFAYDSLGPAAVNLSNGNLTMQVGGPQFSTVGGSIGGTFTYNSQSPAIHGLTGDYYQDSNHDGKLEPNEPRQLHRIDPQVNFIWGSSTDTNDSPNPGVMEPDYYTIRWTGALRAPTDGDYQFVTNVDDTAKITLNGQMVLDAPCCGSISSAGVHLTAGSYMPITVDFSEAGGQNYLQLKLKPYGTPDESAFVIPSDWLSPITPVLPDGWSRTSVSFANGYDSLRQLNGQNTVVTDDSGADHVYIWNGSTWAPPAGEDGSLTQNPDSTWTLQADDGNEYDFGVDGHLLRAISSDDDSKPGAPTYTYSSFSQSGSTPVRLQNVADVYGRKISYYYGGSSACPTASGFDADAPYYMLCKISYDGFGGGSTDLYYSNAHLARIVNPGGEENDFGYDPQSRLSQIRGVLTNDLINDNVITDGTNTRYMTTIAYDDSNRVSKVTAPVANATMTDDQRANHSYEYSANNGLISEAKVHAAGMSEPKGYLRDVSINAAGHSTQDKDVANVSTDYLWNDFDQQLLRTTDHHFKNDPTNGLVSTAAYNAAGFKTDSWGPGAPSEFGATSTHSGGASSSAPHSSTEYDGGTNGLATTWYNSPNLQGKPVFHNTVGAINNWGSSAPAPQVNSDEISARLTGEINLSADSTLSTNSNGARVLVDDSNKIDNFGGLYAAEVAKDSPRNWFRFNDTAGSTQLGDQEGNGPNPITGSIGFGQSGSLAGQSNQAASFNGSSYALTPVENLSSYGEFTIETILNPQSSSGLRYIGGIAGDATNDAFLRLDYSTGSNSPQVQFVYSENNTYKVLNGPTLPTGDFSQVAVTIDPDNVKFYVNGTQKTSTARTGIFNANGAVGIGTADPSGGASYLGTLDEFSIYGQALGSDRINAHHIGMQTGMPASTYSTPIPAGVHKIEIDYSKSIGSAQLILTASAPFTLSPRYGFVTKTTDADGRVSTTQYGDPNNGDPLGSPKSTSVDPLGLNLVSNSSYEARGSGYFRQTSRTLPAGNAFTYQYYGQGSNPVSVNNPCPGGASSINQGGALMRRIFPDPDGNGPQTSRTENYVYDEKGETVAYRLNNDPWTCTSYDQRGRVTQVSYPSGGLSGSRAVSYSYGLQTGSTFDPTITSVTDSSLSSSTTNKGVISSQVDWIGRTISYTDVWKQTTTSQYDQAGRVIQSNGPMGNIVSGYDSLNRPTTTTINGAVWSNIFYDDASNTVDHVDYPIGGGNGTGQRQTLDSRGRPQDLSFIRLSDSSSLVADHVSRTASGNIIDESVDGVDANPSGPNFSYDGAGRLTDGYVPGHHFTYDFTSTDSCGFATTGKNSNRVKKIDVDSTGTKPKTNTTTYCYDQADALTSTSDSSFGSLTYDSHGSLAGLHNGKTSSDLSFGFDQSDRHTSTTQTKGSATSAVSYTRDATDRIVQRKVGSAAVNYGFTGDGDTPDFAMSGKNIVERYYSLPGGASVTTRSTGNVWSYTNIHGDVVATADSNGIKQGATLSYDPDGNALGTPIDDAKGNYDFGWLGGSQRGVDSQFAPNIIEMGARMYAPQLGRFLEVDPVEGGCADSYSYVSDSENKSDLTGLDAHNWNRPGSYNTYFAFPIYEDNVVLHQGIGVPLRFGNPEGHNKWGASHIFRKHPDVSLLEIGYALQYGHVSPVKDHGYQNMWAFDYNIYRCKNNKVQYKRFRVLVDMTDYHRGGVGVINAYWSDHWKNY